MNSSFIFVVSDITSGVYRVSALCLFEQFWSVGIMLLPVLDYFSKSWTEIYVFLSTPTVILIGLYRWIPDAPRWLLAHGKVSEAQMILEEASRINNKPLILTKEEIEIRLKSMSEKLINAPKEPSFWQLWEGKGVTKNLICICLAWSVYIIIYYGFLLNVRPYGRDYLEPNTAICGVSEIIGTFIGLFFILKTERKWLWTGCFNLIASIMSFCAYLIPPDGKKHFI